jgi:transcriptional regulator with XRE-family HTH domain
MASSLRDKEYRDAFVVQHITRGVPLKIRAMRKDRGWSQKELADRVGMTQEGVSRLENPNYGKLTLTTLMRLASVFDVGLDVDFVPYTRLVDKAAYRSRDDMHVPDYEHDPGLHGVATTSQVEITGDATPPIHGGESEHDVVVRPVRPHLTSAALGDLTGTRGMRRMPLTLPRMAPASWGDPTADDTLNTEPEMKERRRHVG